MQLGVDRVGGGEQKPAGVGEGDAAGAALHGHGARASIASHAIFRLPTCWPSSRCPMTSAS
jgi:hypothetical protein